MANIWKDGPGFPARETNLDMSGGLRLCVRQTTFRSEISNRKFSFALYRTVDGMRSCLWSEDDVPCDDMDEAKNEAVLRVLAHLGRAATEANALHDAVLKGVNEAKDA